MRLSIVIPVAAALAAVVVGSSPQAFATSRGSAPTVRDHRTPKAVTVRDHRTPQVTVRDHRTPKVVSVRPEGRKVIRAGRNYDKTPGRVQVIVNGKRVPRRVEVVR